MYSNFKAQAIEYVKQAVEEDNNGNYARAFPLYMNALEYFKTHLKFEKNPKIREAISVKFTEYLRRAEEIRAVLDEGCSSSSGSTPNGLNSVIIREKPTVKWNDVAGLENAKQALQQAVILPAKFPRFYTGNRRPWRAFLLYGPPGTGKSYLAKSVANESDSTLFSQREVNESEASRRIKTELLVQMQGAGQNDEKVLVLAATNAPYALDQAIRQRFDKRIYILLPDTKARQHIFKVHLGDTPHNLTESDFEFLARKSEGFSGSDIAVCVKDVLFQPVRKTQDAMFFYKTKDDVWVPCGPRQPGAVQTTMQDLAAEGLAAKVVPPPIARMDFENVLSRKKPTVSKSDLEVHERFTKEFGEEG